MGIFFFINFVYFTYQVAREVNNPAYNGFNSTSPGIGAFGIIAILYILFYLFWIFYYLIRLYKERDTIVIPNVGNRYKYIVIFTICITIATIVGTFLSFQLAFNSSIQIIAYYGLFNLYIYMLAIWYAPSRVIITPTIPSADGNVRLQGLNLVKEEGVVDT